MSFSVPASAAFAAAAFSDPSDRLFPLDKGTTTRGGGGGGAVFLTGDANGFLSGILVTSATDTRDFVLGLPRGFFTAGLDAVFGAGGGGGGAERRFRGALSSSSSSDEEDEEEDEEEEDVDADLDFFVLRFCFGRDAGFVVVVVVVAELCFLVRGGGFRLAAVEEAEADEGLSFAEGDGDGDDLVDDDDAVDFVGVAGIEARN
jgi:hypothetical protein